MSEFTTTSVPRRRAAAVALAMLAVVTSACVAPPPPPAPPCDVVIVGDSILRDAMNDADLAGTFGAAGCPATVDAEPGRSTTGAATVIESLAATGPLPSVVAVTTAGWDAYTDPSPVAENVDRVMAAAAGRRVVWVNAYVLSPSRGDLVVNATLAAKAAQYPKLTVVNHWSWLDANPQYLSDGFAHLTPAGSAVWTDRLLSAVRGV